MIVVGNVVFNKEYFRMLPEETNNAFKRCWVCGKVKPVSEFHRDRSRNGGYDNKCKKCTKKLKEKRKSNGSRRTRGNN